MTVGKVFINNKWEAPATGETIPVVDPSTGEVFTQIARGTAPDIDRAIAAARAAFDGPWGKMPAFERGRLLHKFSQKILDHHEELAQIEARDTGKPLKQARADITVTSRYFEFYAGSCDKLHGTTIPFLDGFTVMTLREPFGVTGHVLPWNYPAQMFGRSLGGALAAGNATVLKPAEDACLSHLRLVELMAEVGFPGGVVNVVPGFGYEAGSALSAHTGIDHMSFTGSTATGAMVAQAAAKNHIGCIMELGGKSPQVVFADADLDAALPVLANGIIQNAGQTCSAGSRLLVEQSRYDEVVEKLGARMNALRVGGSQQDLDCGPIIRKSQMDRVKSFLKIADDDGLKIAGKGSVSPDAPKGGYFIAPHLIRDVPSQHTLAQDEIFGPVMVAMPFKDEADALRLANGTAYGLNCGVWTSDGGKQMRLAKGIRSGQVYINNFGAGGGTELPFGGVKHSGHGREKGFEALYGFTSVKTVVIKHG
jgi:aldehyde dehydrogenase (NAD+)